jgi:DNA polymerase-3 subunit beta
MNINLDIFRAAILFAGKQDVRYYLNGVHVTAGRVQSSNGHAAFFHKADIPDGVDVIIPREVLEQVLKVKAKECELSIGETCSIQCAGIEFKFRPVDGKFPDCQRIIPTQVTGEAATFNPDYLVACQKAAKVLHGGKGYFSVAYNGIRPAVIRFRDYDTAFAVVMPMCDMTDLDVSSIQWAKQ